ncbi:arylesterase [Nitrogeniibacter mangrovi]|uniref:Arylesterase n=1 Tax=Nitrogeniibacter mangrovi TaxID=2016596 RepID=A0A6C1B2K7_9RHOO|nr:arylesterase [Nitrogeniibacter mangrovi]QID17797.1 arylesterase [Nitrogeniibacter mangrovi]
MTPRSIVFLMLLVISPLAGATTVLVMGDSLSAGYGLRADDAWPTLLQRRLDTLPGEHTVVNASVSGETTAGGRSRLPQALAAHRPDVVVLELGANDGLRGLPLTLMKANLESMIETARQAGARVVLVGMRLPPNYGPAYANKFHAVFAEVADERKTPFVPFLLEGFASRREWFQADGIHPVAAAQPAILDTVWRALQPLIKAEAQLSAR